MHKHRILARISLTLSLFNFVLAAPILLQGIQETPDDGTVVEGDVASSHSYQDATQIASPQHSSSSLSDGSTSSGVPSRYLSSEQSISGYSWLLSRPPRLILDIPPSVPVGGSAFPRPPTPAGLYGLRLPEWLQGLAPDMPPSPQSLHDSDLASSHHSSQALSDIQIPEWMGEFAPEDVPQFPHLAEALHDFASLHSSIPGSLHDVESQSATSQQPHSAGFSEIEFPDWLDELAPEEVPQSPPHTEPGSEPESVFEPDRGTPVTYSPSDRFTTSHPPSSLSSMDSIETVPTTYSSASGGSLSSQFYSATDGLQSSHHSMPEGESLHLIPEGSEPSSPPPDNAKFLESLMGKKRIIAGVLIVGGAIAGIVGSQRKHHKHRDFQYS